MAQQDAITLVRFTVPLLFFEVVPEDDWVSITYDADKLRLTSWG